MIEALFKRRVGEITAVDGTLTQDWRADVLR